MDNDLEDGGWYTPQIVNYLLLITDVFKAVPETKAVASKLSRVSTPVMNCLCAHVASLFFGARSWASGICLGQSSFGMCACSA